MIGAQIPLSVESRTKRPETIDLALEICCLIGVPSASTDVSLYEHLANKEMERMASRR